MKAISGLPQCSSAITFVGLTLCFLCFATEARAQQDSAAVTMPQDPQEPQTPAAGNEVVVRGGPRSPAWTQSRSFASTRFWRLDPGEQEIEVWYSARLKKDGDAEVNRHLWQLEYMVSPVRGVQLDVYFNYQYDKAGGAHIEGAQIETRIAPWKYGAVFLNPTLYLEWHPRYRSANRGEARVLLGGQLGDPRLRAALNLLWEQNLDSESGVRSEFIADREVGGTAAISYALVRNFAVGVETKIVGDQQGDPDRYYLAAKAGPALWASFLEGHLHLTATVMFGLSAKRTTDTGLHGPDAINPLLIVGYRP